MIAHSLYVLRQVVADLKQEATPKELREAADEIGEAAKELYSLARDAKPLPDIHTAKAMEMFGVTIDKVTPEMRYKAKVRNYAYMYGREP